VNRDGDAHVGRGSEQDEQGGVDDSDQGDEVQQDAGITRGKAGDERHGEDDADDL